MQIASIWRLFETAYSQSATLSYTDLFFLDDTIAAISTPAGRGGIGVVRISGPLSREIIAKLAPSSDIRTVQHAYVVELRDVESGDFLDEAVAVYFQAPRSYTGQDVVEISCHGSPFVLSRTLRSCLMLGARAAQPGEFTLRAFSSGRIDLTQAEAVRDLIDAQTEYQAKLASRQLKGEMSRSLQPVKEELLDVIVHLESAVEFVEENLNTESLNTLSARIGTLVDKLSKLADSYSIGRIVRDGVKIAVIGRPNVGKSSLFNALLQQDRAIVTDIPGTTRDSLVESASLGGIPVRIVDTAGIRPSTDVVEKLGIERSYAAMADADLVLLVIDGANELSEEDFRLLYECRANPVSFFKVINKIDLGIRIDLYNEDFFADQEIIFKVSAKTSEGIEKLQEGLLSRMLGAGADARSDALIVDERHYDLVRHCVEELNSALSCLREGYSEEVALYHLHSSLKNLGEITGDTTIEDVLGRIFATFCVGK